MKELQKAFSRAKTALIASHIDPDGDSIGSMLCLGMLLEKLGIKCDFYSQDGVPRIYKFLHCSQKVKNYVLANKHYDILVTLDSSDLKRIGNKVQPKKIANKIINIDHHPDNTKYGDVNFVEASSSTAEILFKIAKDLKIEIDKFMAEALYVALVTDTGNFRYENTSEKTFLMAAELIQAGIKTHDITTKIYDTKKVSSILLFSAVLSTLETSENKKVAWAVVSKSVIDRFNAKAEDLVGLVDHIRSIGGIEVAILFREEKDQVKVNFRSKDKINVSLIAKKFAGGGHVRAAGAIFNEDIDSVKKKVLDEVLSLT